MVRSFRLLIASSYSMLAVCIAWTGNHVAVPTRHQHQRPTDGGGCHRLDSRHYYHCCYSSSRIQPIKFTTCSWKNKKPLGEGAGQKNVAVDQAARGRKCPNSLSLVRSQQSSSVALALQETEGGGETNNNDNNNNPDQEKASSTLFGRIKGYFVQDKEDDGLTFKQRLAKMGVATVLSYGMISNLSYAILISFSWYAFAVKTKLSPLAPGQWKPFLGVYAGFWMFNNVIRPFRVGLSVAIAPSLDRLVLFFQNRFKISKPLAITFTVVVINVVGTTALMVGGIALASILARVPIVPPTSIV